MAPTYFYGNIMAPFRLCFLLVLMAPGLLSGCGQKGPLYLPDETPPSVNTSAPCRTAACAEANTSEETQEKTTGEASNQENPDEPI